MNLKPWREVIKPHKDVATGRYRQAEFAADLAEVLQGTADAAYQNPAEFFARTYMTAGIQHLLVTALRRLTGAEGEPVVQLQTAFGGGKTHTMLALYHLLQNAPRAAELRGVAPILQEAQLNSLPEVSLAVLVGTALNPSKPREVNGITVRTLWGDIAAQLGGYEAYQRIAAADARGVSPGADDLKAIFDAYSPALILIDELVAYMRNLYQQEGLPAGSFDANLTFAQALTEAVKRAPRGMLVATLPESEIEIGGEGGKVALAHLQHVFGRIETIWKPVQAREGFEIVRRRLCAPVTDAAARDAVCRAFVRYYSDNSADFPAECGEEAYYQRLCAAYPIHPELFDRLYGDWSALERFQRTRGVLRLMSAVIHELWMRQDQSFVILPGTVPLGAPQVQNELLRYLAEGWNTVVDNDVDGERSTPHLIDSDNPRFGACGAARRVARTVFLGSAAHTRQQTVRGLEDVRVLLGAAQPGESVAVFNDALGRLNDRLTYLYSGNQRYWYDTRPNLRRTMEERAGKLDALEVELEVERRLKQIRERGDFRGVHVCRPSGDIPDTPEARLVILPYTQAHRLRRPNTAARAAAQEILDQHGAHNPRLCRNMLLFIAADADQVELLTRQVKQYLAWKSIHADADLLNLDAHQRREAKESMTRSDEATRTRLNDAYQWLLVPLQEGTETLTWEEARLAGSQDNPVKKAAREVRNAGYLIAEWSPKLLRMELDRWLWPDAPHVKLKRVWDCLTMYLYLPRLRDRDVLLRAVHEGVRVRDYFGYATGVTAEGHYQGLQFGQPPGSIFLDAESVLVKPEAAAAQLKRAQAAEEPPAEPPAPYPPAPPGGGKKVEDLTGGGTISPLPPTPTAPKRFYGVVEVDAVRLSRDAGQIATEVVQHLAGLVGAEVQVTVEIQARLPEGAPAQVVRTVTENCRTLKFKTQGFEEE